MKLDVILRVIVKLMIPLMVLFALYVQTHGEYGPGGGFQAGVIIAGAVILYGIIFGLEAAEKVVPRRLVEVLIPLGVLIYVTTGLVGMVYGRNFLDYSVLAAHDPTGRVTGIILVEFGVLVTVTGSMLGFFYAFAARGR